MELITITKSDYDRLEKAIKELEQERDLLKRHMQDREVELQQEIKFLVHERDRLNEELVKVYQNTSEDSRVILERLQANEKTLEKILARLGVES